MIKRYILLILITFTANLLCFAQDESGDEFQLIYINHTLSTPVSKLTAELKGLFNDARDFDFPTIFYLANMDSPIIAKVGFKSFKDDVENFNEIIGTIQSSRYLDINPITDIDNLIKIFNEIDYISDNNELKFKSLRWLFYVNQDFWSLNYNETIISKLYYILGLDNMPENYLKLQIKYSGSENLEYNKDKPFGVRNLSPNLINMLDILQF